MAPMLSASELLVIPSMLASGEVRRRKEFHALRRCVSRKMTVQMMLEEAVFGEQLEVIVVGVNGIGMNLRTAKLPAIVEIGAAAGADDGLQAKLFQAACQSCIRLVSTVSV